MAIMFVVFQVGRVRMKERTKRNDVSELIRLDRIIRRTSRLRDLMRETRMNKRRSLFRFFLMLCDRVSESFALGRGRTSELQQL